MIEAIIAIVAAFIGGLIYSKRRTEKKQLERNAKAHERAREVEDEVGSLSDDDVTERLRKRSGR